MGIQFYARMAVEEQLIIEVGRRVQLTATEQITNRDRYGALSEFVDGPGSVLEDRVTRIDPSGSNAIGASIRSINNDTIPDIDTVLEIDYPPGVTPEQALSLVKDAIVRGGNVTDETYRGCDVEIHSRCVTVTYADGVQVDLMPVQLVRDDDSAPVVELFHYRVDDNGVVESYTKLVSPRGFTHAFKIALAREDNAALRETLARSYGSRMLLADKADVAPYPEPDEYEYKSPRIVTIQLLKRFRDVAYCSPSRKGLRKPPSVVIAALAIDAPFLRTGSLFDELVHVARFIRNHLLAHTREGRIIDVRNPGFHDDVLTDRWPLALDPQALFCRDLTRLLAELEDLRQTDDPNEQRRIMEALFGETLGKDALKAVLERKEEARKMGLLHITPSGGTVIASTVATGSSTTAISATPRFGGESDS